MSAERTVTRQGPRIEMLLESLPYIREFSGHTIVIKYGGAAMADDHLREAFATDVVLLKYVGLNPVIVHGGGPEITDYMQRLGLEVQFVQGLRVSDEQTVEIAKMVLIGKLNKDIVLRLNRHGQAAVGLCGDDGSLFQVAKRRVADPEGGDLDLGLVGSIRHVDVNVLNHIAEDYIPVVASVGADAEGRSYNVNADEAAGAVAAALGAYKVIFLTDVEGWLADRSDPATLVSETDVAQIRQAIEANDVGGGMLPKLQACADAVEAGVRSAHIVDGREPHSLLLELFTDAGIGTKVVP
jgi:acetylglutamate kinase